MSLFVELGRALLLDVLRMPPAGETSLCLRQGTRRKCGSKKIAER